jgi:hypothetical protein
MLLVLVPAAEPTPRDSQKIMSSREPERTPLAGGLRKVRQQGKFD